MTGTAPGPAAPEPADPPPTPLPRTVSTKVGTYLVLALALLGGALGARQPQLVALAAPFVVALVAGLVLGRQPALAVRVRSSTDRAIEGDDLELTVTLRSDTDLDRVELVWPLPAGLRYGPDVTMPHAVRLRAGEPRELRYPVVVERWGVHRLGAVVVRVRGPLGFATCERAEPARQVVRAYPAPQTLRHLARPVETTLAVGMLVARHKGDGFEFADIREFVPGDRVRNVNWRATARHGELRVNEHRPERSTDVVVLVDAFVDVTLPAAVRAAVSLAAGYLRDRDRVGVVSFGGTLRWLRLGTGERQLYRVIDALIESAAVYSYAWKALDLLPRQALPGNAILLAVSPLTDPRTVTALLDRAARGTEVAVVRVALDRHAEPGRSPTDRLGHAMWRHEVQRIVDRLRERGVPVVRWDPAEPLDGAIEEVTAFQRYARHQVG